MGRPVINEQLQVGGGASVCACVWGGGWTVIHEKLQGKLTATSKRVH